MFAGNSRWRYNSIRCSWLFCGMRTSDRPTKGVISFIRCDFPFYAITNMQSDLEVALIRIKFVRPYTVCNIDISPQEHINNLQICKLIN